jgi:hypothetical protein
MAKGNNGNLLQHAVETAAAKYLVGEDGRELHFVATHAMRPFEAFEQRGAKPARPSSSASHSDRTCRKSLTMRFADAFETRSTARRR